MGKKKCYVGIFFTSRSIFTSFYFIEESGSPLDLTRLPAAATEPLNFFLAFDA